MKGRNKQKLDFLYYHAKITYYEIIDII